MDFTLDKLNANEPKEKKKKKPAEISQTSAQETYMCSL